MTSTCSHLTRPRCTMLSFHPSPPLLHTCHFACAAGCCPPPGTGESNSFMTPARFIQPMMQAIGGIQFLPTDTMSHAVTCPQDRRLYPELRHVFDAVCPLLSPDELHDAATAVAEHTRLLASPHCDTPRPQQVVASSISCLPACRTPPPNWLAVVDGLR